MNKFFSLLFLLSLSAVLYAAKGDGYSVVYHIGFEEDEGYVLGNIDGQCDWTDLNGNGTNEVSDATSMTASHSLHLKGTEFKLCKDFEIDNPGDDPVMVTFEMKPGVDFTRFALYSEGTNDQIINMHVKASEVATDTSGYCSSEVLDLDTNSWYEVSVFLEPASLSITSFYVGESVEFIYNENQNQYRNHATASDGSVKGFMIYNNWNDNTDSYIDDFYVAIMPEPACLGLLALAGLFFLRKRS
ncbi:hypothetical protein IKS73_01135 [bacterium]|nr:hypothetical protein [bacterium]